jgi:hypothetical protein
MSQPAVKALLIYVLVVIALVGLVLGVVEWLDAGEFFDH